MNPVLCCWECKLVQPLWKRTWRFFQKLKTEPYVTAIPLPGIHPEKPKTLIQKDTHTLMFTEAIASTQDIEATQVSINKRVDKEDVVWEGDSRGRAHMYTYG